MATSRCTCGEVIRWKADESQSDEWFLAAWPDLPDEPSTTWPHAMAGAAFCSACGRLWVAWPGHDGRLSEYVPTDPTVRPVRPSVDVQAAAADERWVAFESEVRRVMADGQPSSGHDLDGMTIDIEELLADLPAIDGESVDVRSTGQDRPLLRAICQAAPGVTLEDAAAAVLQLWLGPLRYHHFEAHQVWSTDERSELHVVTQIAPGGLYITADFDVFAGALGGPIP